MQEEVNYNEIKKLFDIKQVNSLKNLSLFFCKYELAAAFRDQEKYLETPEGKFWANEEVKRIISEERSSKLKRIFKD